MELEVSHKKILEYLKKHETANTYRLSRNLKIDRIELIELVEELAREGLIKLRSGMVSAVDKSQLEKHDERLRILAAKVLSDVEQSYVFHFCNGSNVKNIHELITVLRTIGDDVYQYHANIEKNDFSNWIKDVLGDEELASSLKMKDREEAIKILRDRIENFK